MQDITTGALMRKARKEAGLTQRELADRVGVSLGMVSRYEHDRDTPRSDRLQRIAAALGCTMDDLMPPMAAA